jgi:NDP-sugar pyrophosphorylase family protein
MTTVDSVCSPETYAEFVRKARLFSDADVVLGLTDVIEDEKPLRVTLRGEPGPLPSRIEDDPRAFEITALATGGTGPGYITAGFYFVKPTILKEKDAVLSQNYSALRQLLGHVLHQGYRFYGAPLPPVHDVDRPEDILSAERHWH